jgi:hypothetical protein
LCERDRDINRERERESKRGRKRERERECERERERRSRRQSRRHQPCQRPTLGSLPVPASGLRGSGSEIACFPVQVRFIVYVCVTEKGREGARARESETLKTANILHLETASHASALVQLRYANLLKGSGFRVQKLRLPILREIACVLNSKCQEVAVWLAMKVKPYHTVGFDVTTKPWMPRQRTPSLPTHTP